MKLKMWSLGQIQWKFSVNSTDLNGIGHTRTDEVQILILFVLFYGDLL